MFVRNLATNPLPVTTPATLTSALPDTLTGKSDLPAPMQLYPAFYGCFDW